jgi:hypothetical protein
VTSNLSVGSRRPRREAQIGRQLRCTVRYNAYVLLNSARDPCIVEGFALIGGKSRQPIRRVTVSLNQLGIGIGSVLSVNNGSFYRAQLLRDDACE